MENTVAWALFVTTMVLHSVTFIFLQFIADKFQHYMSLTEGDATNKAPTYEPLQAKQGDLLTVGIPPASNASRKYYQELHETLDVSIFR